jgi:hypothetical protein
MSIKTIYGYKNTASQAGHGKEFEIETTEIIRANCWFNFYGNPSYVFHMENGDTYLLVDDYGAMNKVNHLSRTLVNRKKDMFNRFA